MLFTLVSGGVLRPHIPLVGSRNIGNFTGLGSHSRRSVLLFGWTCLHPLRFVPNSKPLFQLFESRKDGKRKIPKSPVLLILHHFQLLSNVRRAALTAKPMTPDVTSVGRHGVREPGNDANPSQCLQAKPTRPESNRGSILSRRRSKRSEITYLFSGSKILAARKQDMSGSSCSVLWAPSFDHVIMECDRHRCAPTALDVRIVATNKSVLDYRRAGIR